MQVCKSPDINAVAIEVMGVCHKCRHQHRITAVPDLFGQLAFDWEAKHRTCEQEHPGSVEFLSAKRTMPRGFDDRVYEQRGEAPWWLEYRHNADAKVTYVADAAITMDLSALASSSTFLAGRESSAVTNSSNYLDYRISGTFISGTTPTTPAEARLYLVTPTEDTPTWPDVFDGTDSAETVTNTQLLGTLPMIWSGLASATSNITYPVVNALTVAQAIGFAPKAFVLYFAHYHTAALKTDAGNTNSMYAQGMYVTIA